MSEDKKKKNLMERMTYAYIRNIKKWMYCPNCKNGKMHIDKDSNMWICKECGYELSVEEFEDDMVFWYCDGCGTYLNIQDGFDPNESTYICKECGFLNDITESNIKGECRDCGKLLDDPDATLCDECRQRHIQNGLILTSAIVGAVAAGIGIAEAVSRKKNNDYTLNNGENVFQDISEYDDDYEALSVYDAADIWLSSGKDEDYMFGYTEDELENAL